MTDLDTTEKRNYLRKLVKAYQECVAATNETSVQQGLAENRRREAKKTEEAQFFKLKQYVSEERDALVVDMKNGTACTIMYAGPKRPPSIRFAKLM